jgi:hypothetical protein
VAALRAVESDQRDVARGVGAEDRPASHEATSAGERDRVGAVDHVRCRDQVAAADEEPRAEHRVPAAATLDAENTAVDRLIRPIRGATRREEQRSGDGSDYHE